MLYFHLKILREKSLDFGCLKNLITQLVQFDNAAVFISATLLAGSKQKPCVILRSHGVKL